MDTAISYQFPIIQCMSEGEEFTLVDEDGRISCLRQPDGADYWLHETYGIRLGGLIEDLKSDEDNAYEEDGWICLASGRAWADELHNPENILPDYEPLLKEPEGTVYFGGDNRGVYDDIMRGPIMDDGFWFGFLTAMKCERRDADVSGDFTMLDKMRKLYDLLYEPE